MIGQLHDEGSWSIPDGPHVRPPEAGLRLALPIRQRGPKPATAAR